MIAKLEMIPTSESLITKQGTHMREHTHTRARATYTHTCLSHTRTHTQTRARAHPRAPHTIGATTNNV